MSLIDPQNPARWADGTPRSQHTGFTHGFGERIDARAMQISENRRRGSTKGVENQRAAGAQVGSIPLMGRKHRSISVEGHAAGQASTDKRAALRRGGI